MISHSDRRPSTRGCQTAAGCDSARRQSRSLQERYRFSRMRRPTLPSNMPPTQRRPDVSWIPVLLPNVPALLDPGPATRGCSSGAYL
jgi:hypothetical protein